MLVGAQTDALLAPRLGVYRAGHCVLDHDVIDVSFDNYTLRNGAKVVSAGEGSRPTAGPR